MEITRKKSSFLEGTFALHVIEEIMSDKDALIIIDPFLDEEKGFKKVRNLVQRDRVREAISYYELIQNRISILNSDLIPRINKMKLIPNEATPNQRKMNR